nr:trigger factor [Candidatus Cardinium hertigii]
MNPAHGIISITLHESDYKAIVEQQLKHYAQKVRLKGFRVGAVPLALVKKMHGQAILAEELRKIAYKALQDYVTEEAIPIFIEPLLVAVPMQLDLLQQDSFTFSYEVGLLAIDNVALGPPISVTEFEIESVEDALVDELIEGLQWVHGQALPLKESDVHALLQGSLTDSIYQQQIKVRIAVERVPSPLRAALIGCHVGDKVTITQAMLADHSPAFLGLTFREWAAFCKQEAVWSALFTIEKIAHVTPAELNIAFFNLLLGEGVADSQDAFRSAIVQVILKDKRMEAHYAFYESLREELFKYNQIALPEAFIKKWISVNNPNATAEEIAYYYTVEEANLKFEFILGSIVRNNNLAVTQSDVIEEAKRIYTDYAAHNLKNRELEESDIQGGLLSFLQKDSGKHYAQLHEKLSKNRAIAFIKQHIAVISQKVTAAQFDARLKI